MILLGFYRLTIREGEVSSVAIINIVKIIIAKSYIYTIVYKCEALIYFRDIAI